ncbi:hypothetical protein HERIO_529 [Hepatospora eriocheir]|uniref:Microsporidial 8TM transmembrane domain-containing protein n=1 Tax=Hepatospora eriocheir TaxID=1081669 RepID=A0A1X0QCS6_9MICR|nr:hypothetical protein HERIO_529 [Hepatospora eriocheir]
MNLRHSDIKLVYDSINQLVRGVDDIKFNFYPSLNILYYYHLNIDEQFYEYFNDCTRILGDAIFIKEFKFFLSLKPFCTFNNYLLFIHKSKYLPLYFTFYICFMFYNYEFNENVIVNSNFIKWLSVCFNTLYFYDNFLENKK